MINQGSGHLAIDITSPKLITIHTKSTTSIEIVSSYARKDLPEDLINHNRTELGLGLSSMIREDKHR